MSGRSLACKGKTAGLNLTNCWWLISKAILKCFWSLSPLITSMAGAGGLDYSQIISEAKGALNKFLLIFWSISMKEQMKSILLYCIHCARFSAGLDRSLGCIAPAWSCWVPSLAECWVCNRTFARVLGCGSLCSCSSCAMSFSSAVAAMASCWLETHLKCWATGETRVARQPGLELLWNMWRPPGCDGFKWFFSSDVLKFYVSHCEKVKFRNSRSTQGEPALQEEMPSLFDLSPQSCSEHCSERRVENRQKRNGRTGPDTGGRAKARSLAWERNPAWSCSWRVNCASGYPYVNSHVPDLTLNLHPDNLQIWLQNYSFEGWLESGLLHRHMWCQFWLWTPETCSSAKWSQVTSQTLVTMRHAEICWWEAFCTE